MQQKIKHYWQVYCEFIRISFAHASQFRVHFILLFVMDLIMYLILLFSIDIIYRYVGYIKLWDKNQFLFFTIFSINVNQILMTFASENYWRFSVLLRQGDFDYLLLKPLHTIFLSLFMKIRPGSMSLVIVTIPTLIYFGIQVHLSVIAWILLPFLLIFACALQVCIDILFLSSIFWTIEGRGVNMILLEIQSLSRWPSFIYPKLIQRLFIFILPILLINTAPVRWLYNIKDIYLMFIGILALVIFSFIIRVVWNLGIKAYESASS